MPGYTPLGPLNKDNPNKYRDISVKANNQVKVGEDPLRAYNSEQNSLFEDPALYDMQKNILRLKINLQKTLLSKVDTEVILCCMRLPASAPADDLQNMIWAPTSLGEDNINLHTITEESIKRTPYIDPGYQWEYIQVEFDPPVSTEKAVVALTFRSANDLMDRARIVFYTPGLTRVNRVSGVVDFTTAGSGDGTDWKLFAPEALWSEEEKKFTFFIREGIVLKKGKQVTLRTYPDEFRLPVEMVSNFQGLELEARSFDGIDEVIRKTPCFQSSRIPHIREFNYSELVYENGVPGGVGDVTIIFKTNRPMFVGTSIYLRLAGFQAKRIDIPIIGPIKYHFRGEGARFDLPANVIELKINKTLYCNENKTYVVFEKLILPPALYRNDESLLIKTSDPGAEWQPIQISPEISENGNCLLPTCVKTFDISQVLFTPAEPRMPANITLRLKPTVIFYQGDKIVLHLFGFLSADSEIPLHGPDAYRIKDRKALWYADVPVLVLVVAKDEIITNTQPLILHIHREANFRLPDKLSLNDGILRLEGYGAYILKEPFKKTPRLGGAKYVIKSQLIFEPRVGGILSDSIARISMRFIINCDVLPNSTIFIKLGGIEHDVAKSQKSGPVPLSGANAPMFEKGMGIWDQDLNMLTVKMIPEVMIYAGEEIRFFIETDQYFKLPAFMYPNDPSFRLEIPEAGITPDLPFNFSTRVGMDTKRFLMSKIIYNEGKVAFPSTPVEVNFMFMPNVIIPTGSVIRFRLPGYTSPVEKIRIAPQAMQLVGIVDLSFFNQKLHWDQAKYELTLTIPVGKSISRTETSAMRILYADGGFRLPAEPFLPNDERLTIAVVRNQIIFEAPFIESPRVVDRSFIVSVFRYYPPQKENIFLLKMELQPTVNITYEQPIMIVLPGFVNSLSKLNIHIAGSGREFIYQSMGQWNATTSTLTMRAPPTQKILAFRTLHLEIQESQGFILPKALDANDSRILIESLGNIPPQPIKDSPMVGNGPHSGHLFCMYQHERGVRTERPICTQAQDCVPPLTDPCSPQELERCGCGPRSQIVVPIKISGFNLQETDVLTFMPQTQLCGIGDQGIMSSFSLPNNVSVNEDRNEVSFYGISSIDTGTFRICVNHVGKIFDVGTVVVRPKCQQPMVMVDGVCVENCPKSTVPVAGNCLRDPVAGEDWDSQALMLGVRMTNPSVAPSNLADSGSDEPERRYFVYRFTYELAALLDCDPKRIVVASLSNGSLIVNTVFTPVPANGAVVTTGERSAMGLISLLKALQKDASSTIYESAFFMDIDREFSPAPLFVRLCSDNVYRAFCPYEGGIASHVSGFWMLMGLATAVAAGVTCCCAVCWNIDRDEAELYDQDKLDGLRDQPERYKPQQRLEYARSWLEGRFVGESWQNARDRKFLALGN
eukprot:TRINITY_DN12649_c0_g3_i2.p1 TRINITY_DN12649_c0_g3~~TRINITY_DN12649_c0_g3_i2.p1  ORF type:complete len:1560 (-),score=383.63 TRINITY_DN12649_c0_g3_i2:256-4455(-)